MIHVLKNIFIFLFLPLFTFSQHDTTGKVKYTNEFIFNDGIYLSFQEFKNNKPSIKNFTVKKSQFSNPNNTTLEFVCPDSIKSYKNCNVKDCWGYCYRGDVYIAHSYYSYYFRLMVIGSLCHFYGLNSADNNMLLGNDIMSDLGKYDSYQQFMLDFGTGEVISFTFKTFSYFLKTKDIELYKELMKQKKKRRLIFQYLLKYNEKHPIWFNQ